MGDKISFVLFFLVGWLAKRGRMSTDVVKHEWKEQKLELLG